MKKARFIKLFEVDNVPHRAVNLPPTSTECRLRDRFRVADGSEPRGDSVARAKITWIDA